MSLVFNLEKVSVSFEKYSVKQRSLKYSLGRLLRNTNNSHFQALQDINLKIEQGENIGLIGRNGAGKSTLLRVLTRVISPQKGKIFINHKLLLVPLLELGIGFHPDLTGRENCYLAGLLMGYSRTVMEEKMAEIIRFSELAEFIDEPVKTYSSGMYARLAFAIATDVRPEVLLVDEVFSVGDEFFIRKCILRMQKLMKAGTTTVFVSHNLDFLVTHCNRLIWLDQGRVVMDGEPTEVALSYRAQQGHF